MTKHSREPLRSLRATCEGRKEESKPVDFFKKKKLSATEVVHTLALP